MRNSPDGLRDTLSPGKAGAPPTAARSRQARARGQVSGRKGRPFRQRAIAVCRALPWCDPTPEYRGRHEVASVGIYPYGLGRPAMCSAGWSPVGGGNVGHWKWRNTSFSRGCWKSFPTGLLEMEEVQGSRHFQISKAISTDMKASPAGWTPRMPQMRSRWKNFRLNTRRSGGHESYL